MILAAVLMLARRPRRYSLLLGLALVAGGVAGGLLANDAADYLGYAYKPGLGMYLTLLVGILLVPIGLCSALIAELLRRRPAATPKDPPAPGSVPQS